MTDEEIDAIALAVYRRLVGGSVALLNGPSSGDPLDVVHSADFSFTFDAEVAADSELVFTIRRDVADSSPSIEIIDSAIDSLLGETPSYPDDAAVERLSSTQCRVVIAARSLVLLPPGSYVAEFRELTAAGETLGKLEFAVQLRRSPSRRIAE